MIGYVYLAGLLLLLFLRLLATTVVNIVGKNNAFGLRNAIARERGIRAYRAWLPFEGIRPAHIAQSQWEEKFAWPANNEPPYRPLLQRLLFALLIYAAFFLIVVILLEFYFPIVLTWFGELRKLLFG